MADQDINQNDRKRPRTENGDKIHEQLSSEVNSQTVEKSKSNNQNGEKTETRVANSQSIQRVEVPRAMLPLPDKNDRFEISFFNKPSTESMVRVVADLFGRHLDNPNLEIEAKLGYLMDRSNKRVSIPVLTEAVISSEVKGYRFYSDMPQGHHYRFNQLLNNRLTETKTSSYTGHPINYEHLYERDVFYENKSGPKVRVTFDSRTNKIVEGGILIKNKLEKIDIYSPTTNMDFRISLNEEIKCSKPSGTSNYERTKDRLSYTHDSFRIDLTQVTTSNSETAASKQNGNQVSHELEVEIYDLGPLRHHFNLFQQGKPNLYYHLVQIFIHNVRILARCADRF